MRKNRILLVTGVIAFILVFALVIYFVRSDSKREHEIRIDIISIVEIDPVIQLRNGFKDRIMASEYANTHRISFTEYNAQGDNSLINQIADQVILNNPDMVCALGTPVAQAIQKRAPELLLVQPAATDPVGSGLANSWSGSGRNYVATTDMPPVGTMLSKIRALMPNATRIGLIYNPGETNSVAVVQLLKDNITEGHMNFSLVERGVSNSSEVNTAAETLIGKVDLIFIGPDNTAYSAIEVIGGVAIANNIPLFTTVETSLTQGAVVALGIDYYELGAETADIALSVLEGKRNAGEIPIRPTDRPRFVINEQLANKLGLSLSAVTDDHDVEIKQF